MLNSRLLPVARISRELGGYSLPGASLQYGMLAAEVVPQGHSAMCTVQCLEGASTLRQATAWLSRAQPVGELALKSACRAGTNRFCRVEATASRQPQQPGPFSIQGLPGSAASLTQSRCYSTGRVWSQLQHAQPWLQRRQAAGRPQRAQQQLQVWRGFASRAQEAAATQRQRLRKKSGEQGLYLVALVVGMVGLTYASVPLYRRVHGRPATHALLLLRPPHHGAKRAFPRAC